MIRDDALQAACPTCDASLRLERADVVFFPADGQDPAAFLFECRHCRRHSLSEIDGAVAGVRGRSSAGTYQG